MLEQSGLGTDDRSSCNPLLVARPAVCPRLRNGFELDASRSAWGKANAGAGNLYRSQHELLPLFTSEINNDPRLPLVAQAV
jgi:hypothetical protein